jgi:transposase
MSKALSVDLRERVLKAVAAGATHREAAQRFGVSAASVSRWRTIVRERGDARPKALGGDRRSGRIDAHQHAIVDALGPEADRTIEEVRQLLQDQGLTFSFGSSRPSSWSTRSSKRRRKVAPARLPIGSFIPISSSSTSLATCRSALQAAHYSSIC